MTEPRGTLLLKSTFHGAAPVEAWPIVVKEITVVGSRCGPFGQSDLHCSAPARLILRHSSPAVFAMKDAPAAIAYAQKRGVLKSCSSLRCFHRLRRFENHFQGKIPAARRITP